ncbi:hypothetical protein [Streptomyces sp. NPDC002676]
MAVALRAAEDRNQLSRADLRGDADWRSLSRTAEDRNDPHERTTRLTFIG